MASVAYIEVTGSNDKIISGNARYYAKWITDRAERFEIPEGKFEIHFTAYGLRVEVSGLPAIAAVRSAEAITTALQGQPGVKAARVNLDASARPATLAPTATLKRPELPKMANTRLAILLALQANHPRPVSSPDLGRLLNLNPSLVHHHLKSLAAQGIAVYEVKKRTQDDPRPRRGSPTIHAYRLTPQGLTLGAILAFLCAHQANPRTAEEVAIHLGQVRATVVLNLKLLIEIGVIEIAGNRITTRESDTPMYRLIAHALSPKSTKDTGQPPA